MSGPGDRGTRSINTYAFMVILIIHAMARYVQKRKRSSNYSKRPIKRRRATFKKKKFTDYTSLNTKGSSLGYSGKKQSRRAFRKHLWDSTTYTTKYRSAFVISQTVSTPATNTTGTLTGHNMYKNPATSFWITAGGALPSDSGGTLPVFQGDITLRGGRSELTFHNTSTSNDVRVRLFCLKTTSDPNFAYEPVAPSYNWDPSLSPDFNSQIGKTYMMREVVIEQGNSYTFAMKLKLQRIDEITYLTEGYTPLVYSLISNVGHTTATNVIITKGYNVSFCADGT